MFVPVVGIISPSDIDVIPSIMMLAGVVIGGRSTLLGPVIGTLIIRFAETQLSEACPSVWTYVEGAIFILVIAFAPMGLGQIRNFRPWLAGRLGHDSVKATVPNKAATTTKAVNA